MTVHRKHREPLRQCSIDGCPYMTRDPSKRCPLHREATR